jgi:hypothetical protein
MIGGLLEDGGDELKGIDAILYAYTFFCIPEETRFPASIYRCSGIEEISQRLDL